MRTVSLGLLASAVIVVGDARPAEPPASIPETQWQEEADAHIQYASQWRVLAFAGSEQGQDYPFQQWYAAAGVGYQFKPISSTGSQNIDPDKNFHFLFGAGYEYLDTSSSEKIEHRITIEATPGYDFPGDVLVRDRSWLELRWINGQYSTTYRNRLTLEHEFHIRRFRFSPYGSVEAFYDGTGHSAEPTYGRSRGSWNQWWYTGGLEVPYEHRFMLQTFYRREDCPSCKPEKWNVWGLTLNFFFSTRRGAPTQR
jgi:hypothetical protein